MAYDMVDRYIDDRMYEQPFILSKNRWDSYTPPSIPLDWKCVKFERDNANQIPEEKGVYAFFIEPRMVKFPLHGYLIYIGQTGYKSKRHLRKRYGDYLHEKERFKRPKVNFMLNSWEDYLYFYFAKVDTTKTDLKALETELLNTFKPPFVERGYSAHVGKPVSIRG